MSDTREFTNLFRIISSPGVATPILLIRWPYKYQEHDLARHGDSPERNLSSKLRRGGLIRELFNLFYAKVFSDI